MASKKRVRMKEGRKVAERMCTCIVDTHSGNGRIVINAVSVLISTTLRPPPLLAMVKILFRQVGEYCVNLLQLEFHFYVEYCKCLRTQVKLESNLS